MSSQLRIGVDLDGCLANFNQAFAQKLRDKGCDVPASFATDPPTWDWPQKSLGIDDAIVNSVWDEIDRSDKFWRDLSPLFGAPGAINYLNDLQLEGHEIIFLTLRRGVKAQAQSAEWLMKWGMAAPTVLTTPGGKARLAHELRLTHVVDDYPRILQEYCMHAAALKDYPSIYMVEHAYNQHCQGWPLIAVKGVTDMLEMITQQEVAA